MRKREKRQQGEEREEAADVFGDVRGMGEIEQKVQDYVFKLLLNYCLQENLETKCVNAKIHGRSERKTEQAAGVWQSVYVLLGAHTHTYTQTTWGQAHKGRQILAWELRSSLFTSYLQKKTIFLWFFWFTHIVGICQKKNSVCQ